MDAWTLTNKNLSERILETERAKKQSMENLETTNHDLTNMDYNIKLLKKAIEEKNPSRMVAESRLEVNFEIKSIHSSQQLGSVAISFDDERKKLHPADVTIRSFIQHKKLASSFLPGAKPSPWSRALWRQGFC